MTSLFKRLTQVPARYTNPIDQQRVAGLLALILTFLVCLALAVIVVLALTVTGQSPRGQDTVIVAVVLMPVLVVAMLAFIGRGNYRLAAWLLIAFVFASITPLILNQFSSYLLVFLLLPLIIATFLLGRRGLLWVMLVTLFILITGALLESQQTEAIVIVAADRVIVRFLVLTIALLVIGGTLYAFGGSIENIAKGSLEGLKQLEIVSQFRTMDMVRQSEADVYALALEVVRGQLKYNFAQVFIVGADKILTQRLRIGLSTSEGYTISTVQVGDANILNEALLLKQTVSVSTQDDEFRHAHFLPSSTYGLAVPVIIGDRVVAVLDIQDNAQPFTATKITALEFLAQQMAVMLHYVRTRLDLQNEVSENQKTIENLRIQLRQYKQSELIGSSSIWDSYLEQRGVGTLGFNMQDEQIVLAKDLPEAILSTLTKGDIHLEAQGDAQLMTVPIELRDEVIGGLVLQIPANIAITDRQKEFVRNVTNRLGLALENKRLFEQSQSAALRERRANEISGVLIAATDVDAVLSLAAKNFNDALGAVHTQVYLQADVMMTQETQAIQEQPEATS